ncbi:murein hydrolase activator EnvC family protein [Dialister pneumosintes]|jgi:Membrane proteins related to metalloendopeptidases|uniref:Peptidase M23 n=1 Tax=Dialister pneumosintes TaxID=39950 RepID=A0A1B3WD42_9FIRM|nr:M23 family metallopeptidase [Dialister pneumosintes]AOH38896.1 peptidase M23 [Dialister pneumosintes]RID94142.1 peptidase M23 [Dialister pneumosintes]
MKERTYIIVPAMIASMLLFNLVSPTWADDTTDSLNSELESIQGQIGNARAQKASAEEIIREIAVKLHTIQVELDAANAELDRIHSEEDKVNAQIKQIELELEAARKQLLERQDLLNKRIRAIYIHGQLNYLEVIMGSKNFSDFANRLELLKRVIRSDYNLIQDIRVRQEQIQAKMNELSLQKQELEKLAAEATKAQQAIEMKRAEQQAVMDSAKAQRDAAEQMEQDLIASSERIRQQIQARQGGGMEPQVIGSGILGYPCSGPITSPFGYRIHPIFGTTIYHSGIDIGVDEGTPVHAADSGVVIYSGSGLTGYGNVVIIDHGNGLSTLYAHNSALLVSEGESVSKGQVVAYSGMTGYATGPHVHFEVRVNGSPTDPMGYL